MTVRTKFSSDDRDVQKALDRMVQKTEQLTDKNRQLAQQSRQASDETTSMFDQGTQGAITMLGGLFSVQTAIQQVTQATEQWRQEMEQLGQESRRTSDNLVEVLAGTGDLAQLPQVQATLRGLQGVTETEATQLFGAVSGAAPTVDQQRRLEVTAQAARAGLAGVDLEQFGTIAGGLARIDETRTAEDVADLAFALQADAGSEVGKIANRRTLAAVQAISQTTGLSQEQAFGFALESLRQTGRAETVTSIATAIQRDVDVRQPSRGRPLTEEDEAFNRFAQADAAERLEMIFQDPQIARQFVGGEQATRLALFDRERISQFGERFTAAQREDLLTQTVNQVARSEAGAERIERRLREAETEDELQNTADRERRIANAREFVDDMARQNLSDIELIRRNADPLFALQRRFGGLSPEQEIGQAVLRGDVTAEQAVEFTGRTSGLAPSGTLGAAGSNNAVEAIREQTETIREQTETIRQGQRNPNVNQNVEGR